MDYHTHLTNIIVPTHATFLNSTIPSNLPAIYTRFRNNSCGGGGCCYCCFRQFHIFNFVMVLISMWAQCLDIEKHSNVCLNSHEFIHSLLIARHNEQTNERKKKSQNISQPFVIHTSLSLSQRTQCVLNTHTQRTWFVLFSFSFHRSLVLCLFYCAIRISPICSWLRKRSYDIIVLSLTFSSPPFLLCATQTYSE